MPVLPQEPVLFPDSSFGPALTPTRGEGRVSYTRPGPSPARHPRVRKVGSFLSLQFSPTDARSHSTRRPLFPGHVFPQGYSEPRRTAPKANPLARRRELAGRVRKSRLKTSGVRENP
jgi:hypothetical protein